MKMISATENAREDGRDCAVEWRGAAGPGETLIEWRARCRATIIREFESGRRCALCPAGSTRDEFLPLLAEWERGFDAGLIEARTYDHSNLSSSRADSMKRLCGNANTVAALLSVIGVFPQAEQQSTLILCADIARGVCSELDALVGGAS